MPPATITGGGFQNSLGNPLADGYLIFQLSQDARVATNQQVVAGYKVTIPLDSSGNGSGSIWANDVLSPAGTFYNVSAYSAEGQLVWGPNPQQVLSTPSPFNIGAWIPASVNVGSGGGGGGSGTVTSVSVVTANGFSGTVANSTTTPAITISPAGFLAQANEWGGLQAFGAGFDAIANSGVSAPIPAVSGVNQPSPTLSFTANIWNGSASTTQSINLTNSVNTSAVSALSELSFTCTPGGTGSVVFEIPTLFQDNVTTADGLAVEGSLFANCDVAVSNYLGTGVASNTNSPVLSLQGGYFDGTLFQPDEWSLINEIGVGTSPTSDLILTHSGSPGNAQFQVPNINVAGNVNADTLSTTAGAQVGGTLAMLGLAVLDAPNATSSSGNMAAPQFRHTNQFWNGTSSQSDEWNWTCAIGTGTTPTSKLTLSHSGSSGDAEVHVQNLNLDSAVSATSATSGSASALPGAPAGYWEFTFNGGLVKIPYWNA